MPSPPAAEWFISGIIEERKLNDFLLSPTHPIGKHKLRLWKSVFGLHEGEGKLLERLMREQLEQAIPEERPSKIVGRPRRVVREWELVIPHFRGPNGNVGPVRPGWALEPPDKGPHLSTAFPIV